MGGSRKQTNTTTVNPPQGITNFINRYVLPNIGQPGFSHQPVPPGFPIGAGPNPYSQTAGQGLLSYLSGPFQQQYGNVQGAANAGIGQGFGFLNQGAGNTQNSQLLAALGLNPGFNPVAAFNLGLSGEAADAFSRLLSGNPFGGVPGALNVGGGGGGGSYFQGEFRGGTPTEVDPQEVIDQTTRALTDNFFERVLPGVTSNLIGTGNLGGSRGEILTANSIEDFNAELARQIAGISFGAADRNADRAAAIRQASIAAGATTGAAGINARASAQNAALQAMLQAAGQIQGGINAGFSPFHSLAVNAGLQGGQALMGTGSDLFGRGLAASGNLLNTPLAGLELLNTFGLQDRTFLDSIVQRALPIWQQNQIPGLMDLQGFGGILGNLYGGSGTTTSVQQGPGRDPLSTILGIGTMIAGFYTGNPGLIASGASGSFGGGGVTQPGGGFGF